jgi:hypothetical protein
MNAAFLLAYAPVRPHEQHNTRPVVVAAAAQMSDTYVRTLKTNTRLRRPRRSSSRAENARQLPPRRSKKTRQAVECCQRREPLPSPGQEMTGWIIIDCRF